MEIIRMDEWRLSLADKVLVGPVQGTIEEGQVLGIIGESGSGKTVLTRALLGVYPEGAQQEGHLWYKGQDMAQLSAAQWQQMRGKEIGYMAQQPMAVFNECQTIFSHARELLGSHGMGAKQEVRNRMRDTLKACNLSNPDDVLRRYPFELSGGMLQRCMMAMLLALDTSVLICDEPTSALDVYNTKILISCLQQAKAEGKTMIIVTHDYEVLQALADTVMVLKRGDQIEYGAAETLLYQPQTDYAKRLLTPVWKGRYHDDRSATHS